MMSELFNIFKSIPNVKTSVLLSPYTTWNIGGHAELFWEPQYDLLPKVMQICYENQIPVHFLGRGSNVLVNDAGLKGLVICTKKALLDIRFFDGFIVAQAGVPLPRLAKFAASIGFGGYEFLIGIPGTVGGGIVINAGLTAKKRLEMSDILIEAEILKPDGSLEWRNAGLLNLKYRSSNLLDENLFLTRAKFKPTWLATEKEIRHKTAEHLAERRRKQPLGKATAGSTFKQPHGGKPAGWYIDQAGLKGFQIGGAKVSNKHANWIENVNHATAEDVKKLMENIVKEVDKKFGITLEKEVRFLD